MAMDGLPTQFCKKLRSLFFDLMNIFTISIVEIIMRVYTRVRFFVWKVLWTEAANWTCSTKIGVRQYLWKNYNMAYNLQLYQKINSFEGIFQGFWSQLSNTYLVEHLLMTASVWRNVSCLYMVVVLLYIYGTFNKRWEVAECTLDVAVFSLTTTLT